MADFEGKITGRFVDDDDIVRTGRALIELDGFNMLHVPVPSDYWEFLDSAAGKVEAVSLDAERAADNAAASEQAAATSASNAAKSEANAQDSATAAAGSATEAAAHADRAEQMADSAPIIVSALPSSPLPGRIYLVTE